MKTKTKKPRVVWVVRYTDCFKVRCDFLITNEKMLDRMMRYFRDKKARPAVKKFVEAKRGEEK